MGIRSTVFFRVQAALDSIATAKDRNPQAKDYMDTTFIEEIKNSGYIDRLYGKR